MTGQRRLGQKVVAEMSGGRTATGNTTPSAGGACGKEGTSMGPGVALGWPCVCVCLRLGGQRALSGCSQLRGGLSLQGGGWLVCTRSQSPLAVTQLFVHRDLSSWQEGPAPGRPHTCQLEPGVCCLCPAFPIRSLKAPACEVWVGLWAERGQSTENGKDQDPRPG